MAEAETGGDRTEAATPRRLERARQEGRAPVSRELTMLAALACGGGAAMVTAGNLAPFAHRLAGLMEAASLREATFDAPLLLLARTVLPVAVACLLGAAGATLLQTGFLLHAGGLRPQFSRIDPRAASGARHHPVRHHPAARGRAAGAGRRGRVRRAVGASPPRPLAAHEPPGNPPGTPRVRGRSEDQGAHPPDPPRPRPPPCRRRPWW